MVRTSTLTQVYLHDVPDRGGAEMSTKSLLQMLTVGATVAGAGTGVVKSIGFVPENHVGLKERWRAVVRYGNDVYDCRAPRKWRLLQRLLRAVQWITWKWRHKHDKCALLHRKGDVILYKSGWQWSIPWAHKFNTVSERDDFINLPCHEIRLSDDTIFEIKTVICYRVIREQVYATLYGVTDYKEALTALCVTELRELLSELDHGGLRNTKAINASLLEAVETPAKEWGLQILSFKLAETAADADTQSLIQMPKFAQARADAIQTHATSLGGVNVGMASVITGNGAIIATESEDRGIKRGGTVAHLSSVEDSSSS